MSPADSKGAGADQWHNPLRDKWDKRLPRIAGPCAVVLFGVTGDLARKKVMPAIYDLANRGLLPPTFSLVGFALLVFSFLIYALFCRILLKTWPTLLYVKWTETIVSLLV